MATIDIINRIKKKIEKESDYAVAKILGISTAKMSQMTTNNVVMTPDEALIAARILEVEPEEIALELFSEKSKKPETKDFWKKRLAETAMIMILLNFSNFKNQQVEIENKNLSHQMYIMLNI